jgi:WD40 repeat protein
VFGATGQVAFNPDGQLRLAGLREEKAARLFDVRTGTPTSPYLRHKDSVTHTRFSPDGKLVLTCSADRTARLWDAHTGFPVGPPWANFRVRLLGCFTADGASVLLGDETAISR